MNAYAYGKVFIVVSDNYYTSVIRALFSVYFEFKKKKKSKTKTTLSKLVLDAKLDAV